MSCRACLESSDQAVDIFSEFEDKKIVDLIQFCTGIEILESDPFPQQICITCLEKLQVAEEIKRKFVEADNHLKGILKTELKEEEDLPQNYDIFQEDLQNFEEETVKSEEEEEYLELEFEEIPVPKKPKTDEKPGNKVKRCQICKLQCESLADLRQHNLEEHSKLLTCEMCNIQMTSRDTFRKHMRSHVGDKPLHVCHCGEQFYLTRHFVIHKCPIRPICHICNLQFTCRKEILRHIEEMHREEDSSYACKNCPFTTKRSETYFYHLASHFDPIQRLCEICSETFSDLRKYHAHKLKHKKVTTRYSCDLCGLKVMRKANLIRHFRSSHIKTRFPCDLCHRIYTDPAVLKQHKVGKHGLEASFSCELCQQKFIYQSMLRNHMKLHSTGYRFKNKKNPEEKKNVVYECVECKKCFANEANLKRHGNIVHKKIKKYFCRYCQKPFSQKSSLDTHERIHTGEKPFACSFCKNRYSDRSTLHKHLRNIHKEQKPVIQVILATTEK